MKKLLFPFLFLYVLFCAAAAVAQSNENDIGTPFSDATYTAKPSVLNGDPAYRLVATRFENWDTIQKLWTRTDSMHYFYTPDNLLDKVENYQYSAGKWSNSLRETYTYDGNKNRTFLLRQRWNGAGWFDDSRVIYAYDSYNNRLLAQSQSWLNSAWKDVTRSLYKYDNQHNRTEWTRQKPQNNAWLNQLKYIYQYDAAKRLTIQTTQAWDINSSTWGNVQYLTNTYNAAGLRQEELVKIWTNSNWSNNLKATYQYGTDGRLENTLTEIWQNNSWNDFSQHQYEYNKENLVKLAEYQWMANIWQSHTLYENAYDVHNNQTFQRYAVGERALWRNEQQIFSFYETLTGIAFGAENELDFSVGPNPSTGVFTVRYSNPSDRLKRARVTDATGRLVVDLPLNSVGTETIDLSQIPDGIYQLWLTTRQGKRGTKQVIKMTRE